MEGRLSFGNPKTAASATAGGVRWEISFERNADEDLDIDADSFATAIAATATAPGTSGQWQYTAIALASTEIDGLLAWELYRVKIARVPGHAGDTMAGDAQLGALELKET